MISRSLLKYYSSLLQKKYREKEKLFLAEGKKIVEEGLNSKYECKAVLLTEAFQNNNQKFVSFAEKKNVKIEILSSQDFKKISDTETPQEVAAVFSYMQGNFNPEEPAEESQIIYLENIADPGNLGTIFRTALWFGFHTILLSRGSVEAVNPKVLRSSMGAIFRLNIYEDISTEHISILRKNGFKIICADTSGKEIYNYKINRKSLIAFCNEAAGPSRELLDITDEKITIHKFGEIESLNVASAAAVILNEVKRFTP
jgi:RNA methyltransferase, TrmH family